MLYLLNLKSSRLIKELLKNFYFRRIILIILDCILLTISVLIALSYISNDSYSIDYIQKFRLVLLSSLITINFFIISGHYKSIIRYTNSIFFYFLTIRSIFITFLIYLINYFFDLGVNNIFYYLFFAINSTVLISSSRVLARDLLIKTQHKQVEKLIKVAIYGAGDSASELINALRIKGIYNLVAIFDDNPRNKNRTLNGVKIEPTSKLDFYLKDLNKILISINTYNDAQKKSLLRIINYSNVQLLQIPSISEFSKGININSLLPVSIEDLLSRDPITPYKHLVGKGIAMSNVIISGAGGSIGSELTFQILRLKPAKLILLELCEYNLYKLQEKINNLNFSNIDIIPVLGNATDNNLIESLFIKYRINFVYHAAAYKHVSLVEMNPLEGIFNNVFSTYVLCKASKKFKVDKFVFISTDKAVRPTNIMGASKRVAEEIVKCYSKVDIQKDIKSSKEALSFFSIVRFGNVLGSSGSVVPLFKKQILNGGPITLTHKDVIRYFMTISEAVSLVLQASSLSEGGDIFLLDMGEPIKIYDLAVQMIRLSGLTLKNSVNPNGNIEIKEIGLKQGEKLYEELLIDGKSEKTQHPLIFKAKENYMNINELEKVLEKLKNNIKTRNIEQALKLMKFLVPEWIISEKNMF